VTITKVQKQSLYDKVLDTERDERLLFSEPEDLWVRNPSWLKLPQVSENEQKVCMLYAIDYPETIVRFAFDMDTANDGILVDWGDGTTETIIDASTGSGQTVFPEKVYNFNNSVLDDTNAPVEFDDTNNTVIRNLHGYTNGMRISFAEVPTSVGIDYNVNYYVINAEPNNFQLSTTENGLPISFANSGNGYILPYKQALITITPIKGRIIFFSLNVRHSLSQAIIYDSSLLDVAISLPFLQSFSLGGTSAGAQTIRHGRLEHAAIHNLGYIGTATSLFFNSINLRSISVMNLPDTVTITSHMFNGCRKLRSIPNLNTKNVTDMTSMFANCTTLQIAPVMDTTTVTVFGSLFSGCLNLVRIPEYDSSRVNNFSSMFSGCSSLREIPKLNTISGNLFNDMFNGCNAIERLPFINTGNGNNFGSMFANCFSLEEVPLLDLSDATFTPSMFSNCFSLKTIPRFNVKNVVNSSSMFANCHSLEEIPELLFETVTNTLGMFLNCFNLRKINCIFSSTQIFNTSTMFSGCSALKEAPEIDLAKNINASSMFLNCSNLKKIQDYDLRSCITTLSMFSGCSTLEKAPNLFMTIVENTSGMFSNCFNLRYVPNYNTSTVTNMSFMFSGCSSLEYGPQLDYSSCTTTVSMFTTCPNLKYLPAPLGNTENINAISTMFSGCNSLKEIPEYNFNGVVAAQTNPFLNCNSLIDFKATNLKVSFSVANAKLSAAALDRLYTNLPVVSGQTITVTNNWGTATDDPTIATAKGWTVTG
jgi:surface protein